MDSKVVVGIEAGNASRASIDIETVQERNRIFRFIMKVRNHARFTRTIPMAALLTLVGVAHSQVAVSTYGYNNHRTGTNLQETTLNATNVATKFGKLFTRSVGAVVRTQPLIATNVVAGGRTRNLLVATSVKLKVMAFDADDRAAANPVWTRVLPSDWPATFPNTNVPTILSTPVVDPATNTLYVVARSLRGDANIHSNWFYTLYALDLRNGLDKRTPVDISGSVTTTGTNVENFDPFQHQQRPAVTLSGGKIFLAFGSIGDVKPYHGWVFVYDAATFEKLAVLCDTPLGTQGGIWQGGQGLTEDESGNLFTVTGNGSFDPAAKSYGNSVLRINKDTLQFDSFFTPYNWSTLNKYDLDLGCGGVLHIPGSNIVVTGGKQGKLYLLDSNNLGGNRTDNDSNALQAIQACESHIHGTPVYYDGPNGPTIYVWSEEDYLKSFSVVSGRILEPYGYKSLKPDPHGMPGGFMTLSANGKAIGSGVLWTSLPWIGDANKGAAPGVLRAFDPVNLTELWNSEKLLIDDAQFLAKYMPPVVANGKVYVSSYDGTVNVYGQLGQTPPVAPVPKVRSGPGLVSLYWPQVPDTKSYRIARATSTAGPYSTVQTTAINSFVDTNVVAGTTYYYRIHSINDAGISPTYAGPLNGSPLPIANANVYTFGLSMNSTVKSGSGANKVLGASYISIAKDTEEQQGLIKLDLSAVPLNASRVVLRLYGSYNVAGSIPVTVFTVDNDTWAQGKVTWNTRPMPVIDVATTSVTNKVGWWEWDVTSAAKAALAGGKDVLSLGLRADAPSAAGIGLRTKENTLGNVPQEVVTAGATTIQFADFNGTPNLIKNGVATVASGKLSLTTNGVNQASSVFYGNAVNVSSFDTTFDFKGDAMVEGLTFAVSQYSTDIGYNGAELGCGPEPIVGKRLKSSAAIKFDFKNNIDEGANTTSLTLNGRSMTRPGVSLTAAGLNFSSGHVFRVRIVNTGTKLIVTTRDMTTNAVATQSYDVNVFSLVGGGPAYVGFTASTGSLGGTVAINNWVYRVAD